MKFPPTVLAAILAFTYSCGDNPGQQKSTDAPVQVTDTGSAKQAYFPVAAFLQSEINYVDSLPVGIKKYHIVGEKSDSSYIKIDEFHQLASEFISPQLGDSAIHKFYDESSFLDRSNNNATFFYKANDPTLTIQRIDVVTAKGDVYDEVKSIYMEKNVMADGSSVSKKLFWKPQRNFQIITVDPASTAKTNVIKVVWDNRE